MTRTFLSLFIIALSVHFVCAGSAYGQMLKEKHLFLSVNKETLKEVFTQLAKQSGYHFFYDESVLDMTKQVSIKMEDESIDHILKEISRQTGLQFKKTDHTISVAQERVVVPESMTASEEKKTVTGVILDEEGYPVIGANVIEKGTTNGIVTDFDGKFSLEVEDDAVLQITYIGYADQEIPVSGKTTINISMREDTQLLEEVVVVGYGVQKKVNLTGAVGTVKSDKIEAKPVTNVQELLQGKTPGLNITKGSGAPGSGASINIRGTSTIGGSSGVLVIIDGVPGNIYTVNPNDIESVSVLKDAASASIYGSRAANGVILITTKRGNREKELQVSVTSSMGITNPLHFIDFVHGEDFMKLYNIARQNEGNDEFYTEQHFNDYRNGKIPNNVWYKDVFEKNQMISNNHISLSGRTKALEYNISGSYDYQSGMMPKNDYTRYIFKPDITFNATKWMSVRGNVQYTETQIDEPQDGTTNLIQAMRISPITPKYTSEGLPMGPGGTPGDHPIAVIEQGGKNEDKYKELLAIFTATITPLKDWNIRPMYSVSNTDFWEHNYSRPVTLYNEDGSIYSQDAMSNMVIYNNSTSASTKLIQVTTDYKYTLKGKHNFYAFAGYSQEKNEFEGFNASRKNPAFANIFVLDIAQDAKDNGGNAYHDAIQSVFGRINYDYDGKYLLEANIRADGSSRFSKGHRWGTFPSFSLGWNLHRENFFADNMKFISRLKLRGSWGILGDAMKIDRYETRNLLSFDAKAYAFDGSLVGGAWSEASFAEDISWEKAKMTNIGIDMGIWKNHIEIVFEYFNNERAAILYRAPVPAEYGLQAPFINALKMRNRGLEGMFVFRNKVQDFEYSFDFNFNYSKNEVLDLYGSGPWIGSNRFTDEGTQLEMHYGYESIGLFQGEQDIANSADQVNVSPGNIKYKDQLTVDTDGDGIPDEADGVINGDDRVIINDKVPVRFGLNLNLKYKGFDFAVNTYGKLNNRRYLEGYEGWAFFLTTNARPMHLDTWTPDNKDASYPRITTNMIGNDREYSDFWLRKANYLKIQNIQLGYTLSSALNEKTGFDYARIYLSGQNLGILSNYDGFDPEGGNYPLARTFSLGVQLKF